MTKEQEKILREKLNNEIQDGFYTISSDPLHPGDNSFYIGTGKGGYIEYLVALEKSLEELCKEDYSLKEYDIWSGSFTDGFDGGTTTPAIYLGKHKGSTFQEATYKALILNGWQELEKYYDPNKNTYWGVSFFDNEKDANK